MKRVSLTARGATIAFLADELDRFGDALSALIDSQDGVGQFTDDHVEALAELYSKVRVALLLSRPGDAMRPITRTHLTQVELPDMQ